jgi:RNA polymerase sigma-70 factor (ECF subfamily)
MQAREEAIPKDAGWEISIAMVMDKEIAAEVETVISTGMVRGIKIRLQPVLRNSTIRISFGFLSFPQMHQRMTEQALIDGLINQNKEAILYLVNNHQNNIIKTAYYFVSNMQDAEDLSQDVLLEILRSVGRYKKDSSLNTWIYRITVNKSLDHLRKQKRRNIFQTLGSFFLNDAQGKITGNHEPSKTDRTNEDRENRKMLDNAVNSLPENQRIAFILSKYDDLAYKEISEIMNLSLPSVESLIHRAKKNLQNKLANYFSEYAKEIK